MLAPGPGSHRRRARPTAGPSRGAHRGSRPTTRPRRRPPASGAPRRRAGTHRRTAHRPPGHGAAPTARARRVLAGWAPSSPPPRAGCGAGAPRIGPTPRLRCGTVSGGAHCTAALRLACILPLQISPPDRASRMRGGPHPPGSRPPRPPARDRGGDRQRATPHRRRRRPPWRAVRSRSARPASTASIPVRPARERLARASHTPARRPATSVPVPTEHPGNASDRACHYGTRGRHPVNTPLEDNPLPPTRRSPWLLSRSRPPTAH